MIHFTKNQENRGSVNCKTIGILGGLGPETTSKFYLNLIKKFLKMNNFRPPMLIFNVPIPLQLEQNIIKNTGNRKQLIKLLISGAKKLEAGGADFIVIPCNTVHLFIDQIRKSVKVPVLSIVEQSAVFLSQNNITKIKILATSASNKCCLFEKTFQNNNIELVKPESNEQTALDKIILNILSNKTTHLDNIFLNTSMKDSSIPILLACTDLQNLVKQDISNNIFDTMEILAEATVNFINGEHQKDTNG